MPIVIGVDSSTQSTKVELRDLESGELVSSGRATHPDTGAAPLSETNPNEWLKAFNTALATATASKAQTKFAA
ncbi:MAG: xylulokinase, partial [Acidimicrobiaceae bacterium]